MENFRELYNNSKALELSKIYLGGYTVMHMKFSFIHWARVPHKVLTTPENTITYYNVLCLSPQNFAY